MNDRSAGDDLRFFQQRGFCQEMGFGEAPALVVIDIMRAFTDPSLPLGANLDREVDQINLLLDAAHEADIPVFYSVCSYDEADCRDSGIWGKKISGVFTLKAGSQDVELDPRLRRAPTDAVFIKKYASCFFGTDLTSRLQARRVDTLILTGCTTSGCVRATAVDAIQSGFRPIVVREAVGDRSRAAHEQSLFDMQAKYADVLGVNEVIAKVRDKAA
ncbi:MAG: isochorismatase family protein [Alphaproteobacteria bacterium]|nr:isochorismatase family protein [Alphaproteobacteria bacterium]